MVWSSIGAHVLSEEDIVTVRRIVNDLEKSRLTEHLSDEENYVQITKEN